MHSLATICNCIATLSIRQSLKTAAISMLQNECLHTEDAWVRIEDLAEAVGTDAVNLEQLRSIRRLHMPVAA